MTNYEFNLFQRRLSAIRAARVIPDCAAARNLIGSPRMDPVKKTWRRSDEHVS
jgi:hypothetical protein